MSIWSENPAWFDNWLENQVLSGRFGPDIQAIAQMGDFLGYQWWDTLDVTGDLGQEAIKAYIESRIP